MTDTTTAAAPAEQPTEVPEAGNTAESAPPTEAEESTPMDPSLGKARKEAASYRERLRKAEAERDTASTTIASLRRQIVDGQVTALGIKPAALWAAGHSLEDLLDEDGNVDTGLVEAAVTAARESLGLGKFGGSADQGGNKNRLPEKGPDGWGSLLKP